MPTLGEIFSLRGRADAQARAYGWDVTGDDETRTLTVDTGAWNSLLSDEDVVDLRRRWKIETPECRVNFGCEVLSLEKECGGQSGKGIPVFSPKTQTDNARGDAVIYATALRVTQSRGDWADLAPTKTSQVISPGHARYRVRIWATMEKNTLQGKVEEETLTFVDGWFENGGELVAFGPNSPGKVFCPGRGVVIFVHWIGKDAPGFVTLSARFNGECPV